MHITICKVEEEFVNFKIGFGPCQNLLSIVSSLSHNLVTKVLNCVEVKTNLNMFSQS